MLGIQTVLPSLWTGGSRGQRSILSEKVRQIPRLERRPCLPLVAAFDFDFGALDNTENEVSKAYHSML